MVVTSRRRFLALAAATALAGCGAESEDPTEPAASNGGNATGPGPSYGGVASPSEPSPADAPSGDGVRWSVPVGTPVTARPVVVDDVLYLGSGQHDGGERPDAAGELTPARPGYLHAVDVDGRGGWRYAAPAPVLSLDAPGDGGGRGAAGVDGGAYAILGWYGGPGGVAHRLTRVTRGRPQWTAPAADENRFVAAATGAGVVTGTRDERVATTGQRLRSRDRSGGWLWEAQTGDVLAATAQDGRVYATVGTVETRCLDAATGEARWRYPGTPPTWTPRVQGGVVLVARSERTGLGGHPLVALDASTGSERWAFAGRGDSAFTPVAARRATPPGTADEVVYAAGADGGLWAVTGGADGGGERWRYELGGRVVDGPVAVGDRVYVTDTAGLLVAVDAATGTRAWRTDLDRPSRALDATADGGVLVVAATDGASGGDEYGVSGFERDGTVRFAHEAAGGVRAAVVQDGRAFAVTDGGHLARYGPG